MRNATLALVVWLALVLFAAGCRQKIETAETSQTGFGRLLAPASAAAVANMKPLAYAAAALMVVGILLCAFSSRKATGAILIGGGAGIATLYAQMASHPYVSAAIILVPCIAATVLGICYFRHRITLAMRNKVDSEIVKAVEKHPEVKIDIGGGDPETQNEVRAVIAPIKTRLRQDGEIE